MTESYNLNDKEISTEKSNNNIYLFAIKLPKFINKFCF